jgi:hypothetical protein
MIKIKGIRNEDEIHSYTLEIFPNIHHELIGFFHKLKFSSDEVEKLDVIFSELNGSYFHIKKENMKVHFFIYDGKINMVIDTKETQEDLSNLMKEHFTFP